MYIVTTSKTTGPNSLAEFAYNNAPSATTGVSPFFANKDIIQTSLFTLNAILLPPEPATSL